MTAHVEVEIDDPRSPYQLIRTDFRGEKSYPAGEYKSFDRITEIADRRNEGRPEKSDHYHVLDCAGRVVH